MSFPNALTGFQSKENKTTQFLSILHQTNVILVAYIHAIKINWPYRVKKVRKTRMKYGEFSDEIMWVAKLCSL